MIEGKKTLNDYGSLLLTNTMSDLVEMFNNNSNNSALVDNLLSYAIDTGVFRIGLEKVNEMSVGPHSNLQFPVGTIGSIRFTGFIFYFKSLHKIFDEALTVDLSGYKDSKLHLLYLKPDKTFEVLDTKYTGNDDYLLVARFVFTSSGVNQFYIITRNAGTNPFDRLGVKYEVIKGLVPRSKANLTITSSDGTIKYSGINLTSDTNTDILDEVFDNMTFSFRYVTVHNQVDWTTTAIQNIDTTHIADYEHESLTTVTTGKYMCQKAFYDYCSRTFVMQYGTVIYDTYNEALAGASNFTYAEPDWEGIYIPVAVFVIKAGATDLSDDENFHVISITDDSNLSAATAVDPTAQALANTALATAQDAQTAASTADGKAVTAKNRADDAYTLADTANTTANTADGKIDAHLLDTNNPHNVSKSDVGLGNVDNTADASKPLSTPQKTYIDNQVDALEAEIATKATDATQTKCVVKATQPTSTDFGRALIKGDIWITP